MHPVVCMITDRRRLGQHAEAALIRRVALAARAGIHLIQIRERDMADGGSARACCTRRSRPFAAHALGCSSTTGWTWPSLPVRTASICGVTRLRRGVCGRGAAGVPDRQVGALVRRNRSGRG